jgi:hypothetical protein
MADPPWSRKVNQSTDYSVEIRWISQRKNAHFAEGAEITVFRKVSDQESHE